MLELPRATAPLPSGQVPWFHGTDGTVSPLRLDESCWFEFSIDA